MRSFIA